MAGPVKGGKNVLIRHRRGSDFQCPARRIRGNGADAADFFKFCPDFSFLHRAIHIRNGKPDQPLSGLLFCS